MISIITCFRLPYVDPSDTALIRKIDGAFMYWEIVRRLFCLDLVFINDHSENFWLSRDYIYDMPGPKVDWNIGPAKNYGVSLAKGDKLLITDMDHITYADFTALDNLALSGIYFRFPRKEAHNGVFRDIKIHKNTFLVSKKDFPGYDEDFCGNYGSDDIELFYRMDRTCSPFVYKDGYAEVFVNDWPEVALVRDKSVNKRKLFEKTGIK